MADMDPAAWEKALIADLRSNGGVTSSGPLAGQMLIVLHTIGAKTGEPRSVILTTSRDGTDYIVAGTKGGAPADPAWVANLRANPAVTIDVGVESIPVTATIITGGAERDRLWDQHVAAFATFAEYPAKAGRVIPLIRLTPAS